MLRFSVRDDDSSNLAHFRFLNLAPFGVEHSIEKRITPVIPDHPIIHQTPSGRIPTFSRILADETFSASHHAKIRCKRSSSKPKERSAFATSVPYPWPQNRRLSQKPI